ncbi:MAG: hypothetical protein EOP04_08300, partial [Proteobacteria bacterium]
MNRMSIDDLSNRCASELRAGEVNNLIESLEPAVTKSFLILSFALLAACSSGKNDKSAPDFTPASNGPELNTTALTTIAVPSTLISFDNNAQWSITDGDTSSSLADGNGSTIDIGQSDISDINSVEPIALQLYLKDKFPEREYKIVNFNGLKGVRADYDLKGGAKQSDIYLVSEVKDFIHVHADLKATAEGMTRGEQILASLRTRYQGSAYGPSEIKTLHKNTERYSFLNDCFALTEACDSSAATISVSGETLSLSTLQLSEGQIVEIGPDSEVPFDSVTIVDGVLQTKKDKFPLAALFKAFTPKSVNDSQSRTELKREYVYLVRTKSWPYEDLITKIRVDKLGFVPSLTYQKLATVSPDILKLQNEQLKKNIYELSLKSRSDDFFLFKNAERNQTVADGLEVSSFVISPGNTIADSETLDFGFLNRCGKSGPVFDMLTHVLSVGRSKGNYIIDLGVKELDSIDPSVFPHPFRVDQLLCGVPIVKGHSYIYLSLDRSRSAKFLVRDLDPNGDWVRLKMEGMNVLFNEPKLWKEQAIPEAIQLVTLELPKPDNNKEVDSYFSDILSRGDLARGSAGFRYTNKGLTIIQPDKFPASLDLPYNVLKSGFYDFIGDVAVESVTMSDVMTVVQAQQTGRAYPEEMMAPRVGDVKLLVIEHPIVKSIMAIRIDSITPGQEIKVSVKLLFNGDE